MQLFKLVVSMALFGFLFNEQISAKQPEAIIAIGIILAGYLIGGGGHLILRNLYPDEEVEEVETERERRETKDAKVA
ncbi:MAG: hypothetical protein IKR28_11400 [Selenomonadaceae bacterium]|nr:hypothetical protein [Selenomonadaceae bacterium]